MNKKIKQLAYLKKEIMSASFQLKIITDKISEEEDIVSAQILADIANDIAKRTCKLNERIGVIFKL